MTKLTKLIQNYSKIILYEKTQKATCVLRLRWHIINYALHKKRFFPLRISSVNVTKFAGNCEYGHIY